MPLVKLRLVRGWRASAGGEEKSRQIGRDVARVGGDVGPNDGQADEKEREGKRVHVSPPLANASLAAATGVRCFADSVAVPCVSAAKTSGSLSQPYAAQSRRKKKVSLPVEDSDVQSSVGDGAVAFAGSPKEGERAGEQSAVVERSHVGDYGSGNSNSSGSSGSADKSNIVGGTPGSGAVLLLRDGRSALVAARREELTAAESAVDPHRFYDEEASAAEANSACAVAQCAIAVDASQTTDEGQVGQPDAVIDAPLVWHTVHNSPVLAASKPDAVGLPELTVRATVQSDVLRAKLSAPLASSVSTHLAALSGASSAVSRQGALRSSGVRRGAFTSKDDFSALQPNFSPVRVLTVQVSPSELKFFLACGCASRLCGHHSVPQYMPTGSVARKQASMTDPSLAGDGFASIFAVGSDERTTASRLNAGLRQCLSLRCRRPGDLITGFYWLPSSRTSIDNLASIHRHRLLVVTTAGCEVYAFPPTPALVSSDEMFLAPKKKSWFSFGKGANEPAQDLGAPATECDGYWQWTLLAEHRVVDSSDASKQKLRAPQSATESKTTVAWHQWSSRHRVLLLSPAALTTSVWKAPVTRDSGDPAVQMFTYVHSLIPLHFGVPKALPAERPFELEVLSKEPEAAASSAVAPALAPLPVVKLPVSVVLPRLIVEPSDIRTEAAQLQREQYNVAAKSVLQRCRLRSHNVAIHQLYAKLFVVHVNTHRPSGAELWESARSSMAGATGLDLQLPRNLHSDVQRASVDLWQLTRDTVEKRLSIPLILAELREAETSMLSIIHALGTSVVDNLLCVHTLVQHDSNKDGQAISPVIPKCLLFDVKDSDPQQPIVPVVSVAIDRPEPKNLVPLSYTPYFVSVDVAATGSGPNDIENVGNLMVLDVNSEELAAILSAPEHGLNTPKKAVEVLLKRDAFVNKKILISVVKKSVLQTWASNGTPTSQTTHLAGMFDMLNFVLAHSQFKLREDWPSGVVFDANIATANQTQNGCIVVLQSDMFAEVLLPLVDTLAGDVQGAAALRARQQQERYIRGVFLEYLRSLSFNNVPPQPFIAELGVQLLARQKQYVQLHQLVQYHVIPDSVPVACTLLALSTPQSSDDPQDRDSDFGPPLPSAVKKLTHVADETAAMFENDRAGSTHSPAALYAPAAQLAIDMLKRLAAVASANTVMASRQKEGQDHHASTFGSVGYGSGLFNSASGSGLESLHDAQSLRYMVVEALLARHQIVPALRYTLSRVWAAQLHQENAARFFDPDGGKMSKAQVAAATQELDLVITKEQNKFLLLVLRQATRVLEGATLLPAHVVAHPSDKADEEVEEEAALEEVRELRYKRYSARANACSHADFFVVFHAVRKRGLLDQAIRDFVATHEEDMVAIDIDGSDKDYALRWFDSQRHAPRTGSSKNPGLFRRLLGRHTPAAVSSAPPHETPQRRRGNSVRARDIISEAVSLYAEEFGLMR